jgi:hypothetical protein
MGIYFYSLHAIRSFQLVSAKVTAGKKKPRTLSGLDIIEQYSYNITDPGELHATTMYYYIVVSSAQI